MKKFIIYLLPIFFINSSIVYSEEVITINNDTLYNKNNLKKKLNKSFKDNNIDLGVFYSEKLLKMSPNDITARNNYNIFIKKQKINQNNILSSRSIYYSFEDALKDPIKVRNLSIYGSYKNEIYSSKTSLPYDLYRLINLKSLKINNNKLEKIEGIGSLENLEELILESNNIKEIPKEIKNLTKLKKL